MRMMKIAPSDAVESQKGFHYILPVFFAFRGSFANFGADIEKHLYLDLAMYRGTIMFEKSEKNNCNIIWKIQTAQHAMTTRRAY
jgi:hypothetical protein